ncbi:Farnesyl diphosphate synthase (plasmid) [Streptomyces sp. YIM 121038]|uniref:polyprenyl synthetase family protein n=1 Tax=Streptomyces sp. YIM 121038 TaxID=2136401 RepID=UPI001110DE31|nr:polyprenyl synthetase family protein [Streptomyces sp. YIM 121038]QCX82385.1 Farnesyl diphosphate synthase [Streptomyces sp. YIM 121038]
MTTTPALSPPPLDLADVRRHIEEVLEEFLMSKAAAAHAQGLPDEASHVIAQFLAAGGKRLRPLLCVLGWQAAIAQPPTQAVIRVAAALEMFHAFCLIHDDIIDNSTTRRGAPTVHRTLTARHTVDEAP